MPIARPEPSAAARESIRSLRVQLRPVLDEERQSLIILSPYSSTEKSLLVFYLGQLLWKEGRKVLVIESDPAHPAFSGGREVEPDASQQTPARDDPGIERAQLDASTLHRDEIRMRLARWRALYDDVLVNGPPLLERGHAAMLASCCDATLLLIESGKVGMRDLELTRTLLQRAGASLVGSVLADVRGRR